MAFEMKEEKLNNCPNTQFVNSRPIRSNYCIWKVFSYMILDIIQSYYHHLPTKIPRNIHLKMLYMRWRYKLLVLVHVLISTLFFRIIHTCRLPFNFFMNFSWYLIFFYFNFRLFKYLVKNKKKMFVWWHLFSLTFCTAKFAWYEDNI